MVTTFNFFFNGKIKTFMCFEEIAENIQDIIHLEKSINNWFEGNIY